jgi:hypothetical protein
VPRGGSIERDSQNPILTLHHPLMELLQGILRRLNVLNVECENAADDD